MLLLLLQSLVATRFEARVTLYVRNLNRLGAAQLRLYPSSFDFAFLILDAQNVKAAAKFRHCQFRVSNLAATELIAAASRHSLSDSHSWSEGLSPRRGNVAVDIDGSVFYNINYNLIWIEICPILSTVSRSLRKGLRF